MKITRRSKCIWIIEDTRIDIRKAGAVNRPKFKGAREALMRYFEARNENLTYVQIDRRVCKLLDSNSAAFRALESGYAFI